MYEGNSKMQAQTAIQHAIQAGERAFAGGAMLADAPVQVESIYNTLMLIGQQSAELVQRSSVLADALGGPAPQTADKEGGEPNSIMAHLRLISRRLGIALMETERAQRTIHQ